MLRYEKLQKFCHKYRLISPDSRDCDKDRVMLIVNPNEPRFGGWTGALPCKSGDVVVRSSEMEGVEMDEHGREVQNVKAVEV